LISVPVEFLSDEQVAAYGRFDGVPSRAELERFFLLDDADRRRVDPNRGAHNRLGYALQLGTLRFLGTFLEDPLDVPSAVVEYLASLSGFTMWVVARDPATLPNGNPCAKVADLPLPPLEPRALSPAQVRFPQERPGPPRAFSSAQGPSPPRRVRHARPQPAVA
jgi:Domain of unknown function (DUF4158)